MWARRCFAVMAAGLVISCSESSSTVRPGAAEAGTDATSCTGTPCAGTCQNGRCLVKLAEVASPGHVAVDEAYVYFTSCNPDGTGAVLDVELVGEAPPNVLATGGHCPGALALGAYALSVANLDANEVVRIPTRGGAKSVLGSVPAAAVGLATDGADTYVATQSGTLLALATDGGAPAVLVSGEKSLTAPTVDATDVYFGAPIGGTVKKVPRVGGPVTTLTTVDTVTALALSNTDVYFAAGYLVTSVPKAGGSPTTLGTAAGADIVALVIDDASVYFASYGNVWKVPLAGGPAEQLAGGQADVTSLAVDATSVYFTNAVRSPAEPMVCCGSVVKVTPK